MDLIEYSIYKRFSYPKVKGLLDILIATDSSRSDNYSDYSVIKRDKIIFQILYSYGLRPSEALSLSIFDLNFYNTENGNNSFGSIFISAGNKRLVYAIFPEVTIEIKNYLNLHNLRNKVPTSIFFETATGNKLTIPYLTSRLKYYNTKLPCSMQIDSLYTFREYYIADLLRIKGVSQSFINNQIGNNILSNQVYFHLQPDKSRMELPNEF